MRRPMNGTPITGHRERAPRVQTYPNYAKLNGENPNHENNSRAPQVRTAVVGLLGVRKGGKALPRMRHVGHCAPLPAVDRFGFESSDFQNPTEDGRLILHPSAKI